MLLWIIFEYTFLSKEDSKKRLKKALNKLNEQTAFTYPIGHIVLVAIISIPFFLQVGFLVIFIHHRLSK